MRFRPYNELTPTGKFLRKNIARLVIYGGSVLVIANSYYRIKESNERSRTKQPKSSYPVASK
jgi:hypothetical protein